MLFGPKFACLVFSDTNIKIATARPAGKSVRVLYLAQKSLPEGLVANGRIIDESLFKEALRTFFLENYERLGTRNLVLGLNEQDVFLYRVSFAEKPKNLKQAIEEKIAPKTPFDLSKACLVYREISHGTYQVAAVEAAILEQLGNLFAEVGFSIKAIVPLPLAFLKLAGSSQTSYLFVSQAEDLIYSLVVGNTVAFSSTAKLKRATVDSENEIIKVAKEIIEEEYNPLSNQPLRDVFIAGKDAQFIKSFFSNQGFNTYLANPSTKLTKQARGEPLDFSRCLVLSFYDATILSFPKLTDYKPTQPSQPAKNRPSSKLKYFLLLIFLVLAATLFFSWPTVRKVLFKRGTPAEPTNISTTSSSLKQKEATSSSGKTAATPSAQLEAPISKASYRIQVLNGTGKSGEATKMRDFLVSEGYNVVGVGNASNFNYKETLVQIKESKKAVTATLTKDLQERYSISISSPLSEGESFDILIVVGGD